MPFSERDKLKALAIVHVFETSKPFGDYSAMVVLKDGAGVSYGINQFTHRSGSLLAVVNTYLGEGGTVGRDTLERCLPTLNRSTKLAITKLSNDAVFKSALRAAGKTPTMHLAQQQIMENMYLLPAIDACEGSNFTLPLSLAVIYDSINHGSYDRIRDQVTVDRSQFTFEVEFERAWIAAYVGERNAWLANHRNPLLRGTTYRTKFFLHQIAKKNWSLDLPIFVHGVKLTEAMFTSSATAAPSSGPQSNTSDSAGSTAEASPSTGVQTGPADADTTQPPVPVEVKKEDTSLFVKISAAFTAVAGLGLNAGALIQGKLEQMTPMQIGYMVAALGLVALAVWWYRKAAKGAQARTMQLVEKAADPEQFTVKLVK